MKELNYKDCTGVSAANLGMMGAMGALTLCFVTTGFEGTLICAATGFALGTGWFFNDQIIRVDCGNQTTLL